SWNVDLVSALELAPAPVLPVTISIAVPKAAIFTATRVPKSPPITSTPAIMPICQPFMPVLGFGGGGTIPGCIEASTTGGCPCAARWPHRTQIATSSPLTAVHGHVQAICGGLSHVR